jgi:2-dehydro-3-deoxyglucarate aldolase
MNQKLKKIIRNNELSFGSWITLGHPSIPEIMSQAGFQWLVIDTEHSAIDIQKTQDMIQIIDLKGITPLVRLTANDPALIKRVMDAGAYGVIVPMVNTKEDALKTVKAVKYPPLGTRSVGLARAQGYGKAFNEYKSWVNNNSIIIVQIEHIDAVNNIEDIFSADEIDGYLIGPYDLSASLGIAGDLNHDKVLDVEKKVLEVSRKYDKIAGIHVVEPDVNLTLDKIRMGYRFVAVSIDFFFLGDACINTMDEIRAKLKKGN